MLDLTVYLQRHALWLACKDGGARANFKGMNLKGANFEGQSLHDAIFEGANLKGANFKGANLPDVSFRGANLEGANLGDANLGDANLKGANLKGVDFRGANLEGVNFREANLQGGDLRGQNLYGLNLEGANLADANFEGANLAGTNLAGANLFGADLRGANLAGATLDSPPPPSEAKMKPITIQHVDFDRLPINHETMVHAPFEGSENRMGALQLLDYLYTQGLLDHMRITLQPPFTSCRCENNGSVEVPRFLRIDFVSATRVPGAGRQTLKDLWTALIGNGLEVTWKHGDTGCRIAGPDCEITETWELCDDMS